MRSPALSPRILIALVSLALSCSLAGNLRGQSDAGNDQQSIQPPNENTPREIIYPYYSLREGYESTLYLLDRAAWAVEFRMAVHSLSGQTAWSTPMTIHPEETIEFNMKKLLGDLGVDYRGDFLGGSL